MSWAQHAIKELQEGRQVQIRPRGHSMKGRVNDGDLVTLQPVKPEDLAVDDVVLVHIHGRDYLHLIKARDGQRLQIGNNRGGINGWVTFQAVYGKAIRVER
jgi:hypothetical protein